MTGTKLPRHAVYIRWGTFQLNIVGRLPILFWLGALLSLLGIRVLL
jgi:hypothetical protein